MICNVHNGGHWVLAHSYNGDNIMVNDPGYSVSSYSLSAIVDGQNGVYSVGNGYLRKHTNSPFLDFGFMFGQSKPSHK